MHERNLLQTPLIWAWVPWRTVWTHPSWRKGSLLELGGFNVIFDCQLCDIFRVGSHMFQVSLLLATPNMEGKSQLVSLKWSLKYGRVSSKPDLDYIMQKRSRDLGWELRLTFCLTQLATQVPSLIYKKCCHVARHPCHSWGLGLGPCVNRPLVSTKRKCHICDIIVLDKVILR